MKIRYEPTKEDFAGNFIKEVLPRNVWDIKRNNYRPIRQVELQCLHCSSNFIVDLGNAKRIQQKTCSASCSRRYTEHFDGGNENHPLYPRWLSMKQRILNPNCNNFKNYGGRNLIIDDIFLEFIPYAEYIMQLENYNSETVSQISIDRIDNNKGYIIGNLRITNQSVQNANQRFSGKGNNTYTGVSWSNFHKRWVASISFKKKVVFTKVCLTEYEAFIARKEFIIQNKLPHTVQEWIM